VEAGTVEVDDISESAIMARFKAAGAGLPFMPHKSLLGTDMPKYSRHALEITCPFTGQKLHAVRAMESDVTVLHAHMTDAHGNVQFPLQRNTDEVDQMFAKAAKTLIVTAERIIPHEEVLVRSTQTIIPHHWVDAVVEVPYGAHPGSVDGLYREDEAHLTRYVEAAKTPEAFREYLETYVTGVRDHWEYLDRVGGVRHLSGLGNRERP
jgi:glutaconate CoA-transferase subunit A